MTHRISVAPMMDWTDRHDRYFLRLIAPDIRLYTEMITAQALYHGDAKRLLTYHPLEKPLALQLGGSDPALLAHGCELAEEQGYDEVNLNVGCPSPRVTSGSFGACLMLEPQLVADCFAAMQAKFQGLVSVKCRIGVDAKDSYEDLYHFINTVHSAGCKLFIIHARKAWLSGLSPKQNREIPPLRYEVVQQIKKDFKDLTIIVNGGIKTLADIEFHLSYADGVMIGREAYKNPYFLASVQAKYFSAPPAESREKVLQALLPYIQEALTQDIKASSITRHILGLYQGEPGARSWRQMLSQEMHKLTTKEAIMKKFEDWLKKMFSSPPCF